MLILALAAMSLNFLLGYTGVLSFGHAAYFGLGVYGAGMTIKYLVPEHAARHGGRRARRDVAAAIIGALIVRLRGIYFAMVTIAFGQVFYFIAYRWNNVTGGDDGLSGWHRLPIDLGFAKLDILHNRQGVLLFRAGVLRRRRRDHGARCCARPSAARCWRSARTSAARASSASRSTAISGCRG